MARSSIPRRYHSPQRQARADATRQQILAAAERLFGASGYAAVTMEAIARAADVSVATVYLHFPGRAAIVEALAESIVSAPDLGVEQVVQGAEPVEQLRIGAHIIRNLNERSHVVVDILRGAQGSDERLAQLWAEWQAGHLNAMRRSVAGLIARGGLRADVTEEEAVDILYAVTGTEVYRALVRERGWTPQRYEEWLFRAAGKELLP